MASAKKYVAFLRGINVGGNNLLKMDVLKSLCESAGLGDVRTYLQSGNVVFSSAKAAKLGERIEAAIRDETGIDVDVVIRSGDELREVIDANTLPADEPAKLHVIFLGGPLSASAKELVRTAAETGGERVAFGAREIYVYFPNGAGRSKLMNVMTEKKLGVTATARNWNTVTKLAELTG